MKKIISFSLIFLLILGSYFMFSSSNKVIVFSDYLLYPFKENEEYFNDYNYSFSNVNLTSDLLNEYLDNNAKNLKNNKSINKLIKKSEKIYLSVGLNDLFTLVNKNLDSLEVNYSLFLKRMAILEYNIHEIITSILAVKKVEIYYFSLYYLNDEILDNLIYEFNIEISDLVKGLNCNFIEVNEILKINDYSYTYLNQRDLYKTLEWSNVFSL